MFDNINQINKWTLEQYLQFKQEILLDSQEMIFDQKTPLVEESLLIIGKNQLHHMIQFHQNILINFLYFKSKPILEDYLQWIYRVYYNRKLDLDFLKLFFSYQAKVISRHLDKKCSSQIALLYDDILSLHETLVNNTPKQNNDFKFSTETVEFSDALIQGDSATASHILNNKSSNLEQFIHFSSDILSSSMKRIGYLWEANQISIAKQHLASTTIDDTLFTTLDTFASKPKKNLTVLLVTAPYEAHGLGNKIISKILNQEGYNVINLGANLPAKEIVNAIQELMPEVIVMSATLTTSPYAMSKILEEIQQYDFTKSYNSIVSGYGLRHLQNPKKDLNADFYCPDIKNLLQTLETFNLQEY